MDMENYTELFEQCATHLRNGVSVWMVTVLSSRGNSPAVPGKKMVVPLEGKPAGTVGGGALELTATETCRKMNSADTPRIEEYNLGSLGMTCGGEATLCYEFIPARQFFVLFGGGHVSSALAPILEGLGFTPVIIDDREEIGSVHREKGRIVHIAPFQDISEAAPYLSSGFAFVATHGHAFDTVVLEQLVTMNRPFTYVGVIGSKNKIAGAFKTLKEKNLAIPDYVYAPVGLKLGGGAPAEIAVSVAAELLTVMYGTGGGHMRESVSR